MEVCGAECFQTQVSKTKIFGITYETSDGLPMKAVLAAYSPTLVFNSTIANKILFLQLIPRVRCW
jgi:hypothetical protein